MLAPFGEVGGGGLEYFSSGQDFRKMTHYLKKLVLNLTLQRYFWALGNAKIFFIRFFYEV